MFKMVVALMVVFLCPFLGGTILWLTYSHLFAMFPNAHGILADDLGWWDAVCISYFFQVIFGKIATNSK